MQPPWSLRLAGVVLDREYADMGKQLGAGLSGARQIGLVQTQLGLLVTARHAVAAANAGRAWAEGLAGGGAKLNRQGHVFGADAELGAGKLLRRRLANVLQALV